MGKSYLIDSNAIIDFLTDSLPESGRLFMNGIIDAIPRVSIISKLEVLGFKTSEEDLEILSGFFNDAIVVPLIDEVADKTIELRRSHAIKLPDAIIAATALVYELTLITRNTKDFAKIPALECIDPHKIKMD
jgi:predicted nucleic acid-binding protein